MPDPGEKRGSIKSDGRYAEQLTRRLNQPDRQESSVRSASRATEQSGSTSKSTTSSKSASRTSAASTPHESTGAEPESVASPDERPLDPVVPAAESELVLPGPPVEEDQTENQLVEVTPALWTREQIVGAPAAPWQIDEFAALAASSPALPSEERVVSFEAIVAPASFLNEQSNGAPSTPFAEPVPGTLPMEEVPDVRATDTESGGQPQLGSTLPEYEHLRAAETTDVSLPPTSEVGETEPLATVTEATVPDRSGGSGEVVAPNVSIAEDALHSQQDASRVSSLHSSLTMKAEARSPDDAVSHLIIEESVERGSVAFNLSLVPSDQDHAEDEGSIRTPSVHSFQATEQSHVAPSVINESTAAEVSSPTSRPSSDGSVGRPAGSEVAGVKMLAVNESILLNSKEPGVRGPQSASLNQPVETPGDADAPPSIVLAPELTGVSGRKVQNLSVPTADALSGGNPNPGTDTSKESFQIRDHAASALRAAAAFDRPIRIRLSPPELGVLQVEVSRQESGVSARFEVTSSAAQSALNDHLSSLRESLGRAGVSVDRIEVRLAETRNEDGQSRERPHQENQNQHQHSRQDRQGESALPDHDSEVDEAGEAAPTTNRRRPSDAGQRPMRQDASSGSDVVDIQV